ncbi:L-alanine exporter AlaE [Candidatus Woesearchaeota archaeon]|nr:L-alanine exporter AlaE [Candidatus Woesearchaeota archaeon]
MTSLDALVKYGLYGMKRALFMTPVMSLSEIIAGLEGSQSLKARALALGVNFFVAMPYNSWFKPLVYEWMHVTETSSDAMRGLANRAAFALHQIPLYAGILAVSGASLEQMAVVLPTGVAVGTAIAGRFQRFMDKVADYIENKYYQTKEWATHTVRLGKSYAKNLAYATLIAAASKVAISQGGSFIAEHSILAHPEKSPARGDPQREV